MNVFPAPIMAILAVCAPLFIMSIVHYGLIGFERLINAIYKLKQNT